MKVRNGSIELHVADVGDPAAPPILLLHGITSSGASWEWFVPRLAERFRVLRLDFRGHGASDRAPGEYGPAGYLGDAVAAIEQGAGRPCVVIGHSLGGVTAAALTQQRPDLVVAAVLEDPPLGLARREEALDAIAASPSPGNSLLQSFRLIRESAPQLQSSGITVDVLAGLLASAPTAAGATFGERLHSDGIRSIAASLLALDASVLEPVLTGTVRSFLDTDAPLRAPTLIVCADPSRPDAVADPTLARHFSEISPAVDSLVLEGAGHLIHDELGSRERFATHALEFVARVAPPAAG